jgi:hypothetical protein
MQEQLHACQIILKGKVSRSNETRLGRRKELKKLPISEKLVIA